MPVSLYRSLTTFATVIPLGLSASANITPPHCQVSGGGGLSSHLVTNVRSRNHSPSQCSFFTMPQSTWFCCVVPSHTPVCVPNVEPSLLQEELSLNVQINDKKCGMETAIARDRLLVPWVVPYLPIQPKNIPEGTKTCVNLHSRYLQLPQPHSTPFPNQYFRCGYIAKRPVFCREVSLGGLEGGTCKKGLICQMHVLYSDPFSIPNCIR